VSPLTASSPVRDLVRKLRDTEFPWTAATTYLNNASIGPIPERTRLALEAFNARRTAPHLLPDRELMASLADAREAAARLIGADAAEIALTTNTTTGVNVAARALPLERGDVVVVSDREFPANVYPWLALRELGIETELVDTTETGFPDEDYLVERVADPRVRVLAVSFVQFANGFRADLARLSHECRRHDTWLVVDAIQGLGAAALDVRETPVDVLTTGGQKWLLSPWGTGFCYVRRPLIEKMSPNHVGWMAYEGTDDFTNLVDYSDTLRADARRFEVGTIPFQDHVGLTTSLSLLAEIGVATIAAHVRSLHEPILAWARGRDVRIVSPTDDAHRSAILCIAPPDARDAHRRLKAAGVVCALREGAIRLSPHCYNTVEEMERVVEVLDEALQSQPAR
jgi:selenocysteine lyase/cysteine desulfurase